MTKSWVGALIRKEVRALLPVWATTMALAVVLLIPDSTRDALGLPRFTQQLFLSIALVSLAMTPIVLGALSTGHDFAHRTWSLTLTLPVRRSRLFVVKTAVLVGMVVPLWVVSLIVYSGEHLLFASMISTMALPARLVHPAILMPLIGGLTLAPWFALLTRSVVVGSGLAVAALAALYQVSVIGVAAFTGLRSDHGAGIGAAGVLAVWQGATLLVAVAGAWGLQRAFVGGEATEPGARNIADWRGRQQAARAHREGPRRSAAVMLARKELRLQMPTAMVAGLFAVGWLLATWRLDTPVGWFEAMAMLAAVVIALLAGASACAEERQLGTIEVQMLLPVSALRQWLIKVGVVVAVVVILGLGVPIALSALSSSEVMAKVWSIYGPRNRDPLLVALGALTVVALYVSSLSRGGMHAFITACAVAAGAIPLAQVTAIAAETLLHLFESYSGARQGLGYPMHDLRQLFDALMLSLLGVICLMALRFAYQNHRYLDRSLRRTVRQVAWMYGTAVGALAVIVYLTRIR